MRTILHSLALAALTAGPALAQSTVVLDPKLPDYAVTSGVSGNLNSVGSDTLNNLMTFWAEGFKARYPNVKVQIEGKGSSTAPPALATGLAQVDALFSSGRKRGGQDAPTWGGVGLDGAWASRSVSLFGRNSASGTYGFFKEIALKNGDFKSTVKEQPGSSSVVQGIASDLSAVGYSGIGYATSGVRAVALSEKDGQAFVEANQANCESGAYPLARFLYVYVNKAPSKDMDKLTQEFLTFVVSKQGQEITIKDGYFPINADVAAEARAALRFYTAE